MLRTGRARSVDTDGRLATETPAEFSLLRESLTVLVPRTLPEGHRGISRAK
jgi:diacylglycerol kinase family enzyme